MRILLVAFLIFLAVPLMAGEDITPYDSSGHVISPSRMDQLDPQLTCGGCHDVSSKLAPNAQKAHSDLSACLDCHLNAGKDAFTSQGHITRLGLPANNSCLNCHPEADSRQMTSKPAHSAKCTDCHTNAGHKPANRSTCKGCHFGSKKAHRPVHYGLTARHVDRIACGTCHIRDGVAQYGRANGKIAPFASDGSLIHHGVARAQASLGAAGCTDCHSAALATKNYPVISSKKAYISGIREGIVKPVTPWALLLAACLCLTHYAIFGPKRVKKITGEPTVLRFSRLERAIHLFSMLSFCYLAVTGLMFLLHMENPVSRLRSIHGDVGGVFTASTIGMLIIWSRHSLFTRCDADWLRKLGGYFWIKADCRAGKFNAGQKIFFWVVAMGCGLVICITGVMLRTAHGTAAGWIYTLHDAAAAALLLGLTGHIYLSIFANPGALRGIITGFVTKRWADNHHPDWLIHIK